MNQALYYHSFRLILGFYTMSFTVQEVAKLLKQAKENEKPYVFFTGAGCSISAGVPSATGLIEEIRKQFSIQVKNIDHEKDKYNYGKYMSALDKDERRRLLKPHIIDNKKINWAHIALACLMEAGYLERVLTFNFDSILSRACNMLGLHPSIYDFATANPHLYHLINDPSIVHLHGQGTGFVQLNTGEETEEHTQKLGEFIAATLNSNPSLFIGYSGNADAFFPLLEEKYSEQHRLIWTGTRGTIDELEAESVKTFLRKNNNLTHYIGKIYADDFLIELAKELDCFLPELFLNPYTFLEKQLDHIKDYPLSDGLDVLRNLREYLKEQAQKPLIENLYTAFIHKYPTKESTDELSEKAIDEIMWAYDKQARILFNTNYIEDCFILYEQALNINCQHSGCLHNYGYALQIIGNQNNDEILVERSVQYFKKLLELEPDSLSGYTMSLFDLAKIKNDLNLFDKVFELLNQLLIKNQNDTYNISCYYAITNNCELAKTNLLHAEQHSTLPENSFKHLSEDEDLDNVRNEPWFIELLERLKTKEGIIEIAS